MKTIILKIWEWFEDYIGEVVCVIFIGAVIYALVWLAVYDIKQAREVRDTIGREVVISKDTLVVVGTADKGYILSNGLKVRTKIVKDNLVVEE